MSRKTARQGIVVGIVAFDVGPALFALPWLIAAMGGILFAAPWPPGYLVVAAIAGLTALIDAGLWRAATRVVEGARA